MQLTTGYILVYMIFNKYVTCKVVGRSVGEGESSQVSNLVNHVAHPVGSALDNLAAEQKRQARDTSHHALRESWRKIHESDRKRDEEDVIKREIVDFINNILGEGRNNMNAVEHEGQQWNNGIKINIKQVKGEEKSDEKNEADISIKKDIIDVLLSHVSVFLADLLKLFSHPSGQIPATIPIPTLSPIFVTEPNHGVTTKIPMVPNINEITALTQGGYRDKNGYIIFTNTELFFTDSVQSMTLENTVKISWFELTGGLSLNEQLYPQPLIVAAFTDNHGDIDAPGQSSINIIAQLRDRPTNNNKKRHAGPVDFFKVFNIIQNYDNYSVRSFMPSVEGGDIENLLVGDEAGWLHITAATALNATTLFVLGDPTCLEHMHNCNKTKYKDIVAGIYVGDHTYYLARWISRQELSIIHGIGQEALGKMKFIEKSIDEERKFYYGPVNGEIKSFIIPRV